MTYIDGVLAALAAIGKTVPYIERVLDLPQGTIKKTDPNNPELVTLFKIIQTYPWILDVADNDFNEREAKRIMMHAAVDAIVNTEEMNVSNKDT